MLGGLLFLLLKSVEYYHKIESGITLDTNAFFAFYWLLTGFHLIHVIMGLVILIWTNNGMMKKKFRYRNCRCRSLCCFLAHVRFDLASIVSCSLFNLLKMKKTLLFSYGLLILLTVVTALISNFVSTASLVVGLVMGLSMLKFILVSFEFMELKKSKFFLENKRDFCFAINHCSINFVANCLIKKKLKNMIKITIEDKNIF